MHPTSSNSFDKEPLLIVHPRHVVRTMLATEMRHLGFQAWEACSGLDGLRMACRLLWSKPPRAAIIDADVETIGWDAVVVRLLDLFPNLPIIVLGNAAQGRPMETVRFVDRPFAMGVLKSTLLSLVDSLAGPAAPITHTAPRPWRGSTGALGGGGNTGAHRIEPLRLRRDVSPRA